MAIMIGVDGDTVESALAEIRRALSSASVGRIRGRVREELPQPGTVELAAQAACSIHRSRLHHRLYHRLDQFWYSGKELLGAGEVLGVCRLLRKEVEVLGANRVDV